MNKKRKYLVIASIILVCIIIVVLLFSCQEEKPVQVGKNPQVNEVKTYESDVELSDYEEFDYSDDTTSAGRDKSFNQVKGTTTTSNHEEKKEDSGAQEAEPVVEGGLILDESKSSGSNYDLKEWNN